MTEIDRKNDHIELAKNSRTSSGQRDQRFYYEPMLAVHESKNVDLSVDILGKTQRLPFWISSMTGGTQRARKINETLALACAQLGIGMGLGSCRPLLSSKNNWPDFDIRHLIGTNVPLMANLGVAQLDELLLAGERQRIDDMVMELEADGLIIHLNPLQEWYQPEGDRYARPAIETLWDFLETKKYKVMVKEVGQGMGPESLQLLVDLGVDGIEFGAFGGTNFSTLELARSGQIVDTELQFVGHTALEMVDFLNNIVMKSSLTTQFPDIIVSGGVANALDGRYLRQRLKIKNSAHGIASLILPYAETGVDQVVKKIESMAQVLMMAQHCLRDKDGNY